MTNFSLDPVILTLPGKNGSGPRHWQSSWDAGRDDCFRIDLGMWDSPQRNMWVNKINHAVRRYDRPVIVAAHGLGCLALVWWAALERPSWQELIAGALLVAPTEIDMGEEDTQLATFAPTPRVPLPFPSIVVAGQNDPKVPFERARRLAQYWGSGFVSAGEVGHINAGSDLGNWGLGEGLLATLIEGISQKSESTGSSVAHLPIRFAEQRASL